MRSAGPDKATAFFAFFYALCAAVLLARPQPAAAQNRLQLEGVVSGFDQPVALAFIPGSDSRAVVGEQAGKVKLVDVRQKKVVRTLFDLAADELVEEAELLLDVLPHPNAAENRRYFVSHRLSLESQCYFLVSEYVVPEDPENEVGQNEILRINQPCGTATGGGLAFDDGGLLYVGVGVGRRVIGEGAAQSLASMLGKILRVDIDSDDPYGIPEGNPFADKGQASPEVWALGFQNPNRLSYAAKSSRLFVSDQGKGFFEEINLVKAGGNYGWGIYEGSECQLMRFECLGKRFSPPFFQYEYQSERRVIGGVVYRGSSNALLSGRYLFADFPAGRLWALAAEDGKAAEKKLRWNTNLQVSAIAENSSGEIYVLAHDKGELRRLQLF